MADHEEPGDGLARHVHALSRRNLLIVIVFFLSNIVTAVSTLVTAVGVLRESTTDWRDAEYRKLRSLRGGHTIERFTQTLGQATYRMEYPDYVPTVDVGDKSKLTRHVFRPREEYRVEVLTDSKGSTLTYTVTSCHPDFRPWFEVDRNRRNGFRVTLGTSLAEVRPSNPSLYLWMTATGALQSTVSQREETGDEDGWREYAWGSNDACPLTSEEKRERTDRFQSRWEAWRARHRPDDTGQYTGDTSDPKTRSLMKRSVVNVYAETAPQHPTMGSFYPALLGVDRHHAD
ncbi:hypothetical protein [Streptomyces chartreusis]